MTNFAIPHNFLRRDGKDSDIFTEAASEWSGQCVIPILAGHLPNLSSLILAVDWNLRPVHPTTFGMFSQFTSVRELRLSSSTFPSFCAFRRVLVSLPALKHLLCWEVQWSSAPQPSILPIRSERPALHSLDTLFFFRGCILALLEWLIHTPTRSTLVDWDLEYPIRSDSPLGRTPFPDRTLDYYAQVFAPCVRRLSLGSTQMDDVTCAWMLLSMTFRLIDICVLIFSQGLLVRLRKLELP